MRFGWKCSPARATNAIYVTSVGCSHGRPFYPRGRGHYDDAAALYRLCRQEGETVRKLIDCLIGAVAIGADVPVLHNDDDFDVLARHTDLEIAT